MSRNVAKSPWWPSHGRKSVLDRDLVAESPRRPAGGNSGRHGTTRRNRSGVEIGPGRCGATRCVAKCRQIIETSTRGMTLCWQPPIIITVVLVCIAVLYCCVVLLEVFLVCCVVLLEDDEMLVTQSWDVMSSDPRAAQLSEMSLNSAKIMSPTKLIYLKILLSAPCWNVSYR